MGIFSVKHTLSRFLLALCAVGTAMSVVIRPGEEKESTVKFVAADPLSVPVRILHVTDLHGWVAGHVHKPELNADYGDFAAMVYHARNTALKQGIDLLIFDTGDLIEGTGYSDAVPGGYHGEYILPIVAQVPFDGLTSGNHDLGHDQVISAIRTELVPKYNGGYLTSNTNQTSTKTPLGGTFNVITTASGKRVLVMGFIFNFMQAADAATVIDVEKALGESFFQTATDSHGIDFVVVLNHIAPQVEAGAVDLLNLISRAIRRRLPKMPIVLLSGHSHVEDFKWYDSNSFTIESGKYFEEIGQVDFTLDSSTGGLNNDSFAYKWVPTSRDNLYDLAGVYPPSFMTATGTSIKSKLAQLDQQLGLSEVQGCSSMTYDTNSPLDRANSTYRLLIEEIAPKILFSYDLPNIQFFVSSTGFLRYNLYEGHVTTNDVWTVCGFNDSYAYYPSIPGTLLTEIIEELEGLPPALINKRPGCLPPGGAPSPTVSNNNNVGDLPDSLPYFVYSYKNVEPTGTYDVICNSYDAGTISLVLKKIFADQPDKIPQHEWYPNTISDTYMIRDYVRQYMPCGQQDGQAKVESKRTIRGGRVSRH